MCGDMLPPLPAPAPLSWRRDRIVAGRGGAGRGTGHHTATPPPDGLHLPVVPVVAGGGGGLLHPTVWALPSLHLLFGCPCPAPGPALPRVGDGGESQGATAGTPPGCVSWSRCRLHRDSNVWLPVGGPGGTRPDTGTSSGPVREAVGAHRAPSARPPEPLWCLSSSLRWDDALARSRSPPLRAAHRLGDAPPQLGQNRAVAPAQPSGPGGSLGPSLPLLCTIFTFFFGTD